MAAPLKLNNSQQKKVAAKYAKGTPIKALTEEFGVSPATVRAAVVRQGGVIRPVGRPKKA